jgi:hypothetical protein
VPTEPAEKEAAPAKEEAKEAEPTEKVADKVEEKVEAKEPAPTPTETAPTEPAVKVTTPKSLPPELKEIFDKADTKLKSISYLYAGPDTNGRFMDGYTIFGKYTKVDLYEEQVNVLENYFDTVYLNTEDKTATGRCEGPRCQNKNYDNTGNIYDVAYSDYKRRTPREWIDEVECTEILGPEVYDTRSVLKIKCTQNNNDVEMLVDQTYGVPLKITVGPMTDNEEIYMFTDLKFNDILKDSEVLPAFTEPQNTTD